MIDATVTYDVEENIVDFVSKMSVGFVNLFMYHSIYTKLRTLLLCKDQTVLFAKNVDCTLTVVKWIQYLSGNHLGLLSMLTLFVVIMRSNNMVSDYILKQQLLHLHLMIQYGYFLFYFACNLQNILDY